MLAVGIFCQETTTDGVTTSEDATTTEAATTTTEVATTTTEDPASFPKTGELELLVEGVCHSGHMLHWSSRHGVLVMADIWGQQYVRCDQCAFNCYVVHLHHPRFREKDPVTTTTVPDVTTVEVTALIQSIGF